MLQTGVMPTSTNEKIIVSKMVLMWCFLYKKNINVGIITEQDIKDVSLGTKNRLFYPCLITRLCRKNHVKQLSTYKIMTNNSKIDKNAIKRLLEGEKPEASPNITGASGSYNPQPEGLVSKREFEEFREVSQKFLKFMKDLSSQAIHLRVSLSSRLDSGEQGSTSYPRK